MESFQPIRATVVITASTYIHGISQTPTHHMMTSTKFEAQE